MLTNYDIIKIVNEYIGVDSGYLGFFKGKERFTYNSHKDFYPIYCELDINPENYNGTTRERFIDILKSQNSKNQAKILKGILKKYPFKELEQEEQKKRITSYEHINYLINKLENCCDIVEEPNLKITSETVKKALDDYKLLLKQNGAINSFDRLHTILHGYLKEICKQENINIEIKNPTLNNLFKEIKKSPKFVIYSNRFQDIEKIANSIINILDVLNPIRNNASLAHPNENLLPDAEAYLVINATQTILNYLNSKFKI